MKYIITILSAAVVIFLNYWLIFQGSIDRKQEVIMTAKIGKGEKEEYSVTILLKNETEHKIFIPELKGDWIDLRVDLWSLGKGVQLYHKYDAEWRRNQAFVNYDWKPIDPGGIATVVISLSEMMAADPDNDAFSSEVVENFSIDSSKAAYLNFIYRFKVDEPEANMLEYVPITILEK